MVFSNGPGCILHSVTLSKLLHIIKEKALGTSLNILDPRSTEYSKMVDTSRNKREKEASGKIFDWHDLLVKVIRTHKLTVYLCSLWPGSSLHNVDFYNPWSTSGVITPETFDQLQSRSCPGEVMHWLDKRAVRSNLHIKSHATH